MTISLALDDDTEILARRLAEEAIEAEAAKVGLDQPAAVLRQDILARMIEITDGFKELPVLDVRPADDIIGYDEHGLPR